MFFESPINWSHDDPNARHSNPSCGTGNQSLSFENFCDIMHYGKEMDFMRFIFGTNHICTYCGEPSDTVDHTIPYSWFNECRRNGYRPTDSVGFMTYACRECNVLLGNRLFSTFQERCRYVNYRLRNKYRKRMGVVWDEEDLSQLSGALRYEIERQNRVNLRLRERVGWQTSPEFLKMLEDTMDRVYYSEEIPQNVKAYFIDTDYIPCDLKIKPVERDSRGGEYNDPFLSKKPL